MREIQLTRGKVALVDDADYERLASVPWVAVEQSRNRAVTVRVDLNGESLTIDEWAERTGLDRRAIEVRLRRGWSPARALTQPSQRRRHG